MAFFGLLRKPHPVIMQDVTHTGLMWGFIPVFLSIFKCSSCDEEHTAIIGRNLLCNGLLELAIGIANLFWMPMRMIGLNPPQDSAFFLITGRYPS